MKKLTQYIALCASFCLCACAGGSGGGGGGGAPVADTTPPEINISAVGLSGTLSESATVTVNSVADDDGLNDDEFSVLIDLGTNGLPSDPASGASANATLTMTATDPSSNEGGQEVDLTINH